MFLATFFSIFCPSKLHSKFCIEKMTEKVRKSRISVSQNHAQTLPKSMSQKTYDFSSIFVRKMLCCQNADIDSVLVFTVQNGSRTFFFKLLFAWIWGPKNLPKTLEKRCPNPYKIDPKNVLFFNIDFFGFWPRFRRVLGLQDGAKSAALLAAPGVLNPTAFYACINILLCMH